MSSALFFERLESFVVFLVRLAFRAWTKVFLFSFSNGRTAKRNTSRATPKNNKEHKIHALIKHLREIERHEEELSVKLAIARRQLSEEKMKNNGSCPELRSAKAESGARESSVSLQ